MIISLVIESCDELSTLENLKMKLIEEELRKGDNNNTTDEDKSNGNALVIKRKFNKNVKNKEKQSKFNGNYHICQKYGHIVQKNAVSKVKI